MQVNLPGEIRRRRSKLARGACVCPGGWLLSWHDLYLCCSAWCSSRGLSLLSAQTEGASGHPPPAPPRRPAIQKSDRSWCSRLEDRDIWQHAMSPKQNTHTSSHDSSWLRTQTHSFPAAWCMSGCPWGSFSDPWGRREWAWAFKNRDSITVRTILAKVKRWPLVQPFPEIFICQHITWQNKSCSRLPSHSHPYAWFQF